MQNTESKISKNVKNTKYTVPNTKYFQLPKKLLQAVRKSAVADCLLRQIGSYAFSHPINNAHIYFIFHVERFI